MKYVCRTVVDGAVKKGVFEAENKADLIATLNESGCTIISIEARKRNIWTQDFEARKLKKKSLTLFCRQMSTLLRSGIPIMESLEITSSQTDDALLRKDISRLIADVNAGHSLSSAMAKQPDQFPAMLSKMAEIGEITGDMPGTFLRMAEQYESEGRMEKKIRGALAYPFTIMIVAIIACAFMMIKIVPGFADTFASMGAELPAATQLMMNGSKLLVERWYVIILIIPLLIIGLIKLIKTDSVAYKIDRFLITKGPVKDMMQKLVASRFARTLDTLIACGISVVPALEFTVKNLNNRYAEECVGEIVTGVRQGKGIASQMSNYEIFPKILPSMISIGEQSGNLPEMLDKTADYFDEETESVVGQLTTLVEPIMLVVIGLLVGGMVLSLYAPMLSMSSAMKGAL